MKILIAVHHFPPRYTGGAEWRAYRTAAALQRRGHEVQAVAIERIDAGPAQGAAGEDEWFEGVKVRRLSYNLANSPDPLRYEFDNPWVGEYLHRLLEEYRPDVFHLIGGYLMSGRALLVSTELQIPTVLTLTDFWFLCKRISMLRSDGSISTLPIDPHTCARCLAEEKRRYRLPARYFPALMDQFWRRRAGQAGLLRERLEFLMETLNKVDVIISPSEFLRSIYVEAGVEPERILFSRQGRDFPGLTAQHLEKTPSQTLRVGYTGQIAWHKGVHVLFEAALSLPGLPIQVQVFGDEAHFPAYASELRRRAGTDPRLNLCGVYPPEQVSRVFQNLDVLVVPSLWYENSPNVILEAFAHRTPVIASNLGGMAELVQHDQNGLLFQTGDSADLARQLRRLVEEPDLAARLSSGVGPIRSSAEEIDELEGIYQRVTNISQAAEVRSP